MHTPLLRHWKQHISLVEMSEGEMSEMSSLNSKMTHGDRWEHWQEHVDGTEQSHWNINYLSLVVPVSGIPGKWTLMIIFG